VIGEAVPTVRSLAQIWESENRVNGLASPNAELRSNQFLFCVGVSSSFALIGDLYGPQCIVFDCLFVCLLIYFCNTLY